MRVGGKRLGGVLVDVEMSRCREVERLSDCRSKSALLGDFNDLDLQDSWRVLSQRASPASIVQTFPQVCFRSSPLFVHFPFFANESS